MKILLLAIIAFPLISFSQNNDFDNLPFEDLMKRLEDPSIDQQKKAIIKNKIKTCVISKWEHSVNDDTLKLKSQKTIIYYNSFGEIDSIIEKNRGSVKTINTYDASGKLIQRIETQVEKKPMNIGGVQNTPDNKTHSYHYDKDGKLTTESIFYQKDSSTIEINYEWKESGLEKIKVINPNLDHIVCYDVNRENEKIKNRIKTSITKGEIKHERKNEFIYVNNNLVEITNTWMIATDTSKIDSDIANTKFSYYSNNNLKSHQKVYGIWPGESFWISTYIYFENGLINEKEMNNDGEFGHHKIIYRYKYEY